MSVGVWGLYIYDVRIEGGGGVKKPHICGKTVHHFCGITGEGIKNKIFLWTSPKEYPTGRGRERREKRDERGINQSHLQQFVQETGKVVVNCRSGV